MKIMSFNTQHCLNFITRKIDFDVMAEAIKTCQADIVGLNEMRDQGLHPEYGAQTSTLSSLTALDHYFFAKAINFPQGPYGNALLSRYPIVSAESILIPDPDPKKYNGYYETRCLLKARLANGLLVLVTHFGLNPDEQENAVQTILEHLEDKNCILMGDFNMRPDNPLLLPIRERMRDTASLFTKELFSFPSDAPDRKIDYIFTSFDIEVVSADIPAIVASDHCPHVAELKI